MKKLLFLTSIILSFSCTKKRCLSCVALSEKKEIVEHSIICDQSSRYLQGVRDGIVQRYKEQGNNVEVNCKFD